MICVDLCTWTVASAGLERGTNSAALAESVDLPPEVFARYSLDADDIIRGRDGCIIGEITTRSMRKAASELKLRRAADRWGLA